VLLFGIFTASISSCDAWSLAVLRSWFAIWLAILLRGADNLCPLNTEVID